MPTDTGPSHIEGATEGKSDHFNFTIKKIDSNVSIEDNGNNYSRMIDG
ncbi:hypothetical protein ACJYYY_11000 [Brochothrix campestris]